jgi:UDP-4-amino-4,6-dideoxy-N-acetyl-beta-L-altrosamine transaminase
MPDETPPRLPYGRQWIDETDVEAVREVLLSDFLTTGPAVARFEEGLCAATGARHAVALNSGTSALHAMYFAANVGEGTEIVTSPLTFAATGNAALYLGANVRFADVSPDTGNIDPAAAAEEVTDRTRAVVAIDFAGHPADYGPLASVAERAGALVLADAAHSLGAECQGRRVGTLASASVLSFHPVKAITTGEGGAVVTDYADLGTRAARFRTHGIIRDPSAQVREGAWYYEQLDLGYNYRLTDIQAALGLSQLRRLEAFVARRRAIAARYDEALGEAPGLELPAVRPGVLPAWHLYIVRVRDASRRRPFFERLQALGLGVQVHYIPVYWHPFYQALGYRRGLCPIAEDFYARAVSLPMFPRLSDEDVDSAIDRVLQAARETL